MKEVRIKNWFGKTAATVMLYDSVKELPILRYQEFEKLLMQDMGIGSSMEDVGSRFSRLYQFIADSDIENVHKEAKNLHNTFYFILSNFNPSYLAFLALIHTINGKEINLKEPEKIQKQIRFLKHGEVSEIVNEVKKNLTQNYEPCFLTEILTEVQLMSLQAS